MSPGNVMCAVTPGGKCALHKSRSIPAIRSLSRFACSLAEIVDPAEDAAPDVVAFSVLRRTRNLPRPLRYAV